MTKELLPMDDDLTPRPQLSPREHRYLWLMSRGYSTRQAQQIMKTTGTPGLATRVRAKLDAVTMNQAVYNACQLDLLGPLEECGSMIGYRRHHGRHEEPCRACRAAWAEYTERLSGIPALRRPNLTEPETRLLRALDAGRTTRQIVQNWEVSHSTVSRLRASLYRKLDVAHLPKQSRHNAALDEGRRRGYLKRYRPVPLEEPVSRSWTQVRLTDLEVRTLASVADGSSLSQAGEALGIPAPAVSSRLARIYKKLDVVHYPHGERREAAVKAARNQGYPL